MVISLLCSRILDASQCTAAANAPLQHMSKDLSGCVVRSARRKTAHRMDAASQNPSKREAKREAKACDTCTPRNTTFLRSLVKSRVSI
jgi:hypothetical protein